MALEQETDAILRVLTERTIAEHDSYRLDALLGADVPQGIKNFFKAETRRRLDDDLKKSSWFTGIRQSDGPAARVTQALLGSLTDAYHFTRQEFLDTLDLSVHFLANYLCRPQWTLENFLFDRISQIPVARIVEQLAYVSDYRYLGELATRSLQRRGQNEVSREDFHLLIEKIDEEIVRQHNARELAALARPLFLFFQLPGTLPGGAIPVEALLVFLEDKKLRVMKEYIRGICHLRNRPHLTTEELTLLIEDLYAGKTAATAEPVPLEAPEPPVPLPDPAVAASTQEVEPPPPPPTQERATPPGEQQKVNIALSLTFAGLRNNAVSHPTLPEVSSLIQPEQRDQFITRIFKGDTARFAGALVMLDSLKTWQDAKTYLEELYRTNNLDPGADDAVAFSDTIRRRYPITERVPQ